MPYLRYIQGIKISLVLWCSRLAAAICQFHGNVFFKKRIFIQILIKFVALT